MAHMSSALTFIQRWRRIAFRFPLFDKLTRVRGRLLVVRWRSHLRFGELELKFDAARVVCWRRPKASSCTPPTSGDHCDRPCCSRLTDRWRRLQAKLRLNVIEESVTCFVTTSLLQRSVQCTPVLPEYLVKRLQILVNTAATMISGRSRQLSWSSSRWPHLLSKLEMDWLHRT